MATDVNFETNYTKSQIAMLEIFAEVLERVAEHQIELEKKGKKCR